MGESWNIGLRVAWHVKEFVHCWLLASVADTYKASLVPAQAVSCCFVWRRCLLFVVYNHALNKLISNKMYFLKKIYPDWWFVQKWILETWLGENQGRVKPSVCLSPGVALKDWAEIKTRVWSAVLFGSLEVKLQFQGLRAGLMEI